MQNLHFGLFEVIWIHICWYGYKNGY